MKKLPPLLVPPEITPINLPENVKWLAGEGAASYFSILPTSHPDEFIASRYSPNGKTECQGIFHANSVFDLNVDFQISYPSHCQKITLIQENKKIVLTCLKPFASFGI